VLQFAFDGSPDNPHLPRNYGHNNVAYTGTHDNNTTRGWFDSLAEAQKQAVWVYLRHAPADSRTAAAELMRAAWSSAAALAIAPLQGGVGLGAGGRMNPPGKAEGNWRWEVTDDLLAPAGFDWVRALTTDTNRSRAELVAVESAELQKTEVTR